MQAYQGLLTRRGIWGWVGGRAWRHGAGRKPALRQLWARPSTFLCSSLLICEMGLLRSLEGCDLSSHSHFITGLLGGGGGTEEHPTIKSEVHAGCNRSQ